MGDRRTRLAGAFFIAQALGVAGWWSILMLKPDLRPLFFSPGSDKVALTKFLVPDLLILGGFSFVAGWLILTGARSARGAVLLTLGAVTYALVGAIAVNWPLFTCPLADSFMMLAMIGSIVAARMASR